MNGDGLGGLGGGLVGGELQLIACAHGAKQSGGQERLGAHGAVDGHADLIAAFHVGLQVVHALDAQLGVGGQDEHGGVQVLPSSRTA